MSTSSPENWNAPARFRSAPRPSWGEILLQLFDDGEIGIEHVQGLLREVAHIQAGAEPHASGIWSTGSGNHLEQRGLARTVSPHDGSSPSLGAPLSAAAISPLNKRTIYPGEAPKC